MPIQLRLAAILAVAVIAAVAHHRYLTGKTATEMFVATNSSLDIGDRPALGDLRPVALGGNLPMLAKLLVPWEERMMFIDTPVMRDYEAGELLARRDVEQGTIGPYQPTGDEYVMVLELTDNIGIKNAFGIGSEVGFLVAQRQHDGDGIEIVHCGPFTIRQIGSLSRQVDQRIMQKVPMRTVTLSLPNDPGHRRPPQADLLLEAVSHTNGTRIVGLYQP